MGWAIVQEVATILAYGVVGIGVLYTSLKKFKARHSVNFGKAFKANIKLHQYIETARADLNCDRIDLIMSSNGGGIPESGCNINCTLIVESISNSQQSYMSNWKAVTADIGYLKILSQMHADGHYFAPDVTKLDESVVKDAAEVLNLKSIFWYKLRAKRGKYFFLTISYEEAKELTAFDNEAIRVLKTNIIKVLS